MCVGVCERARFTAKNLLSVNVNTTAVCATVCLNLRLGVKGTGRQRRFLSRGHVKPMMHAAVSYAIFVQILSYI